MKRVISSSFCCCHFKDDLRLRSHREKFNIDILAQKIFQSQYTCGEARKKIWDKKPMLNFSRQAHNAKVTDCHTLFRILRFFDLGCFLGRNIDLGGSFPTNDLKFGQLCDSTQNFLDFLYSNSEKNILAHPGGSKSASFESETHDP